MTPEVEAIIKKFNLTRMKVLIQGMGGDPKKNPHHIKNHTFNSVVYTGTHDTNTVRAWFENETDREYRREIYRQLGGKVSGTKLCLEMIKFAFGSKSRLAIIPVQDILCLGQEARMNLPGTTENNWVWRVKSGKLTKKVAQELANLTVRQTGGKPARHHVKAGRVRRDGACAVGVSSRRSRTQRPRSECGRHRCPARDRRRTRMPRWSVRSVRPPTSS